MTEYRTSPAAAQDSSSTLDELAHRVRVAHRDIQTAMRNALRMALDAGDALIAAQARVLQVNPGRWERWLRENCFLSRRTAQLYMRLARHREEIEGQLEQTPDLALRAAARLISKPTAPTDPETATTSTIPLLAAWRAASASDRTAALEQIDLTEFLGVIPAVWRRMIEARIVGLRLDDTGHLEAPKTATDALRKALSLEKSARAPDISPAMANANRTEALVALQSISARFDLNDLALALVKTAVKPRRRAA